MHHNMNYLFTLLVEKDVVRQNPFDKFAGYPCMAHHVPPSAVYDPTVTVPPHGLDCQEWVENYMPPLIDDKGLLYFADGRVVDSVSHKIVGRLPSIRDDEKCYNEAYSATTKSGQERVDEQGFTRGGEFDGMPPLTDRPANKSQAPVVVDDEDVLPPLIDYKGRVVEESVPISTAFDRFDPVEQAHVHATAISEDAVARQAVLEAEQVVDAVEEEDSLAVADFDSLSSASSPTLSAPSSVSSDVDVATEAALESDDPDNVHYVSIPSPSSSSSSSTSSSGIVVSVSSGVVDPSSSTTAADEKFSQVLSELKLQAKSRRERTKSVFEVFEELGDVEEAAAVEMNEVEVVEEEKKEEHDDESMDLIRLRIQLLEARLRLAQEVASR
jgi:hypothetical protein